jgi:hypothetical protein
MMNLLSHLLMVSRFSTKSRLRNARVLHSTQDGFQHDIGDCSCGGDVVTCVGCGDKLKCSHCGLCDGTNRRANCATTDSDEENSDTKEQMKVCAVVAHCVCACATISFVLCALHYSFLSSSPPLFRRHDADCDILHLVNTDSLRDVCSTEQVVP